MFPEKQRNASKKPCKRYQDLSKEEKGKMYQYVCDRY